jgi:hypothetical protein
MVQFPAGADVSSLRHSVYTGAGAYPSSCPVGTAGGLYSGVKWPRRESDDHSPSSGAEVNAWSIPPLPHYVFMAWCLVKHRDSFNSVDKPFKEELSFI